jgi:hypothetical protein
MSEYARRIDALSHVSKPDKFRYLIARNKITRLIDVIDTKSGKVVSAGHANHDAAEKIAAELLAEQRPKEQK